MLGSPVVTTFATLVTCTRASLCCARNVRSWLELEMLTP
jgi:hypothetical protein